MQIIELKINNIFADPTFNCRGIIAPLDVIDLAKDIDAHGLQQPIVVMPIENGKYEYKVITGHRRHKAFQVLKKETIPSIINKNITEAEALILNLGENLHRKDLNILQEAKAIERLKMQGFGVSDVAKAIGKSTTWVTARFQLLELPELIREAAAAGFLTQKQIGTIHRIGNFEKQIDATKKIKEAKLRGEKPPSVYNKFSKLRNILKKKSRDYEDQAWMQNHIQENIGNNFGTRCLAWSMGEINDYDLFKDIEQISIEAEIPYHIPYELGGIK
jgi:ParB family transcriptional regulator, chromosome partitioning protein